jgi:hypothetical protein
MKNWLNKNFKTLIVAAFLIPILTVAVVSISHVTQWYGLSNPVSWAVYLSVGIEIAALSALAAISVNMGSKVYFPFAIVTLVQFIGNIFFAYSYIDIDTKQFKDWVDLVSPFVEFFDIEPTDLVGHKRFLAFFAGGMLPIISLSFLHMLVKFSEEDKKKETISEPKDETQNPKEEIQNPEDLKQFVDESTRIRLSDEDLRILEDALLNPKEPNEKLKEASEKYKQRLALEEMMENDQELGLYDEPFDNPLITEPSVTPQTASEMMVTTNEDIIDSIPSDDEVSDWDVTLMDGLEEEENIFQEEPTEEEIQGNFSTTERETENIFQDNVNPDFEIPTQEGWESPSDEFISDAIDEFNQENVQDEFDGFVPEPFATPEEVEKYKIDFDVIDKTLNEVNEEIDNTPTPTKNVTVMLDEQEMKSFDVNVEIKDIEEETKPSFEVTTEKKNL